AFAAQYRQFLDFLAYRPAIGSRERVAAAAYLLLQDRVAEAQAQLERARPEDVETRLQCAYAQAYLAFSRGQPDAARQLAAGYRDYPVPRWRDRFRNVIAQADEIAGAAGSVQNPDRREEVQDRLASEAPALAVTVEGGGIKLTSRNLASCRVRCYPIDVELLFSRSPFMGGEQVPGRFTFVRPAWEQEVTLSAGECSRTVELPEAFRRRNAIVEAAGEGVASARASHTPNAMQVQVVANYGQLRVRRADNGKPVAGAYVKVYARTTAGEETIFHKDGYTDLRGVFDYASISTEGLGSVEGFAVLVLDDALGAVICQAPPPPR
ncbi:MAG: hypothetical protein PHR35_11470, partial [Kiritimatiellae bacterium]|nr:hypothetical protein [Kiritimatiellia bacterium]